MKTMSSCCYTMCETHCGEMLPSYFFYISVQNNTMEVTLLGDEEEIECIEIPKKLLEDIYHDYLMFTNIYMTNLKEESNKIDEDCYWKYEDNDTTIQTFDKIKFYLER